jgi:thymidylate synthase (FAD)
MAIDQTSRPETSMSHASEAETPMRRVPQESPMHDAMGGASRWEIPVDEHGFVALVDCMPRLVPEGQTADSAIVQAARVSYGLIRYLMRHRHSTPFEMIEFKFHVAMPVFVARQWIRHRTANVNEYSARYSIVPDRFWRPTVESVRMQSKTNRQGGEEPIEAGTAERFLELLDKAEANYREYLALTEQGVARELARAALPVSVFTEWYWKCDLHNILHFLSLRIDPHAQREIRVYAEAMYRMLKEIVPLACEAFEDYRLQAMHLTRLEIEAIRTGAPIRSDNRREQEEWQAKRRALGLAEA